MDEKPLTPAWTTLRPHKEQSRLFYSPARFKVVPAGRRCLEVGTLVSTPYGPKPIEELRVGDLVIGYNEKREPEITTVESVWDNGQQLVYPLESRYKKYLSATISHNLFICNEGLFDNRRPHLYHLYDYKKLPISILSNRHRIKRDYCYDLINGGKHVSYTYSLGVMLGDGCCSKKYGWDYNDTTNMQKILYLSSEDDIIPNAVAEELRCGLVGNNGENFNWHILYGNGALHVIPFYREWCNGRKAHEKIADWDEINTWNKESCMAFIAGLIDTDGSIYYKGNDKSLTIKLGMQAKTVVECFVKIIFKYFQEFPSFGVDDRERYKNGPLYCSILTSNLLCLRVLKEIKPYLKKKGNINLENINIYNVLPDRIGLLPKEPYSSHTFDITVGNSTNLYMLHHGGIITSNSGKTELAKRFLVLRALNPWDKRIPRPCMDTVSDPKYFDAAPTWQQAKRTYWDHLIKLIPDWAFDPDRKRVVSNSELRIRLKSGSEIYVLGLDKPERIEGSPWDGGILDEYGNMHERVWGMHVRPALADRGGWTLFVGVPEGRNHYFDLFQEASVRGSEDRNAGRIPLWDAFTWTSDTVLPAEEIEAAKRDLDPLTYSQEYLGNFISFHGICYYQFLRSTHCAELQYEPDKDIAVCFDFNVSPGVAVICQEGDLPGQFEDVIDDEGNVKSIQVNGTKVIGEVHISRNSNTPMVARKVMKDWKNHRGKIFVYGDATGGAGGTTAVEGSDWDLIRRVFRESDSWNNRVFYRVPNVNPRERARVNAMNSRLKSSTGIIRMMVDPLKCHYTIKDLEGVRLVEGGSGEIDYRHNPNLTHLTSALGYYINYEFPVTGEKSYSKELFW